ncbi:MAG: hypothetical protein ACI8P0_006457, partial [Planctomycetaceae bacterium]
AGTSSALFRQSRVITRSDCRNCAELVPAYFHAD